MTEKINDVRSLCGTECLNRSLNFVERFGLMGVRGKLASSFLAQFLDACAKLFFGK
jgi:hypothetical protein